MIIITGCSTDNDYSEQSTDTITIGMRNIEHTIMITEQGMEPGQISINKGDSVVFMSTKNNTTIFSEGLFSYNLEQDEKISYEYTEKGSFDVLINNAYVGTIDVN